METKHCNGCNQDKPLSDYNFHLTGRRAGTPKAQCRNCNHMAYKKWLSTHLRERVAQTQQWKHRTGRARPMSEAKDSPPYLGVYIAEQALSRFFDNIIKMPINNPGYDFICGKGFKIDCKSSCVRIDKRDGSTSWAFNIWQNQHADYFLCLAFDDRENLNPLHVWLIPGEQVNNRFVLGISNSSKSFAKWKQYEHPLDKVIYQCDIMRRSK